MINFILNLEQFSIIFLMFSTTDFEDVFDSYQILKLFCPNICIKILKQRLQRSVFIVDFEQVFVCLGIVTKSCF